MKTEEALQLLTQIVAQYRGTLEEHQMLQQALQTLDAALKDSSASKKSAPSKK